MYIRSLPHMPKVPFVTLFPNATPEGMLPLNFSLTIYIYATILFCKLYKMSI